jgi:glycerol-3-phosphate dehydrogenase subunit C
MLEAAGLKAVLAPSVCCGLPAMIKGDRARAARIAGHALKRLSPVLEAAGGPLLVLSPSCLWMVKELWPSLNGEAAEAAADRAAEATGFILGALRARLAETGLKPAKRHLAYQAPCHLRLSQSRLPAFGLARLIPGVELHDLGQGCCGQGGTYGMERANANVAATIGRRFEAALNERPYDGLVSECEACRMRLASLSGLKTWHPLEILAEAIE